jgi:hypothetical protein
MSAGWLLFFFLPFLLSLVGRAPMPWLLCFVTSLLSMLLSVEPGSAAFPWGLGMVVAAVSAHERIRAALGR